MSNSKIQQLSQDLEQQFTDQVVSLTLQRNELTLVVSAANAHAVCQTLHDDFSFTQVMDICGVDYLGYGQAGWDTHAANSGFSRGQAGGVHATIADSAEITDDRFAVVYHLLSIEKNLRLRLRVFAQDDPPRVDSVIDIWSVADWFEREAFDLYGILFEGHPDLRRILTDYGFIGHPMRKDFPLSGHVEMRYDEEQKRVIYEPVSIEPRPQTARVIRDDARVPA